VDIVDVNKTYMKGYIDLYVLPVPKKNLAKYRLLATKFGKLAREYGALHYRECKGDDLFTKWAQSFTKAAKPKGGEVLIAAVAEFTSRAHRDRVMKEMFKDPRMAQMMQAKPLADMKRMVYGGFETFVEA
jgi:uncharacterized protein YbaA (DUF1428 family)